MFQLLSIKHKIYLAFAVLISSVIVTALINNHVSSEFNKQTQKSTLVIEAFNLASQDIQSHIYQARLSLDHFGEQSSSGVQTQFPDHIKNIERTALEMMATESHYLASSKDQNDAARLSPHLQKIVDLSTTINRDFELLVKNIPPFVGNGSIYDARFDSLYDKLTYEIKVEAEQAIPLDYKNALLSAKFYIANAHVYLAEFLSANNSDDSEDVLLDLDHAGELLNSHSNKFNAKYKILYDFAQRRMSLHQERHVALIAANQGISLLFFNLSEKIELLKTSLIERNNHQIKSLKEKSKQLEIYSILFLILTLIIASVMAYNLVHKLIDSLDSIKKSLLHISIEENLAEHPTKIKSNESNEFKEIDDILKTVNQHVQDRKRISLVNTATQERIETILRSAPVGLLEVNHDGKIMSSNHTSNIIFSKSSHELINTDFLSLFNTKGPIKGSTELWLDSLSDGKTFEFKDEQGKLKDIRISTSQVVDSQGDNPYTVASILDITDLTQAQSKLAQQTALFTAIIHDAPEAIIIVRKNRTIQSVNPAFCELFGYHENDAINKSTEFLYPSKESFNEAGKTRYNPSNEDISRSFETTYIKQNGDKFVSETVGGSIKDTEGSIIGYMAFIRDISYRKVQENKLKQYSKNMEYNNQRLDIATSSAKLGIWEFDLNTNKLYWNSEMFKIYGKDESSFSNLISEWSESVHPDDLDEAIKVVNLAISENSNFNHEYRIIKPNGIITYLFAHGVACLNDDSKSVRLIGTTWDITDRHFAKVKLDENHQLLSAITRAQQRFIGASSVKKVFDKLLQDILKVTGSQYGYICEVDTQRIDDKGHAYFNVISASEIGNPKSLMEQGLSLKDFNRLITTIIKTEKTLINNKESNQDNSGKNLNIENYMGQPYFYGDKLIGVVGIANREGGYDTDLRNFLEPLFRTLGQFAEANRLERIRTEQQENLSQLALVASKTKNSVIITDEAGLITWANEAYTQISGYSLEESLGRKPGEILQGSGTDPDTVEYMRKQINSGQGFNVDAINYSKSGREYWISIEVQPIKKDGHTVSGFIAVETDITEKREANEELHEALSRSKALAIDAQQASITKSEFLANMSHEIRTPMNGVIGMLNLLIKTGLVDQQYKYASLAYSSAESLLTLINDILDFSKIEAGKLDIEYIDFNITKLITDFSESFRFRAKEKGIDYLVSIDKTINPILNGDPNRIRQILNNICGNALKFTHMGCIKLNIINLTNNQIKFTIQDSGIGIKQENLNTLFEQFTQADGSTTRKYGGTGLGLSISKQLCQLMGGDIKVESEIDKGSTFTFTLKFNNAVHKTDLIKLSEKTKGPNNKPKSSSNKNLLLVEDNLINQEVALGVLDELGYITTVANHGEEALSLLRRDHFSAILMDCQMPIMDGYETTRNIRQGIAGDDCTDTPIIAMTANAMKGDKEKCLDAGMNDYLSKPLDIIMLEEKLTEWVK